jgi:hypothetical protein
MALTYIGAVDFVQSGPPQWGGGQFDLDTLSVEYSGAAPGLDAFLDSLVEGTPSAIDSNMLLVNWQPARASKVYPSVTLNYLGAKGGILPPGRNRRGNSLQTATTSAGPAQVTLTYLAPFTEYTWISTGPADGAIALPPAPGSVSNIYQIPGTIFFTAGSTNINGIGFNNEPIRADDVIVVPLRAPLENVTDPPAIAFVVASTVSDTNFTSTIPAAVTGGTYPGGVNTGFHASDTDVTVISIRYGCGFAGALTGQAVDQWGPFLTNAYFTTLNTPSIESEEIVPGRYWVNTQRNTTSLVANPC